MELEPTSRYSATRRYQPESAVLETTFTTGSGTVTVTDSLNHEGGHPLPWTELARVVRAQDGAVPMRWRVAPGRAFGEVSPQPRAELAPV